MIPDKEPVKLNFESEGFIKDYKSPTTRLLESYEPKPIKAYVRGLRIDHLVKKQSALKNGLVTALIIVLLAAASILVLTPFGWAIIYWFIKSEARRSVISNIWHTLTVALALWVVTAIAATPFGWFYIYKFVKHEYND